MVAPSAPAAVNAAAARNAFAAGSGFTALLACLAGRAEACDAGAGAGSWTSVIAALL